MNIPRTIRFNRYWIIALVWALLLLTLSVIALPAPESAVVLWEDKVNHGVAYGMLAFLIVLALDKSIVKKRRLITLTTAFVLSVLWGGFTEVIQITKNDRSAEGADLLADVIGIAAALLLFWWAVPSAGSISEAIEEEAL